MKNARRGMHLVLIVTSHDTERKILDETLSFFNRLCSFSSSHLCAIERLLLELLIEGTANPTVGALLFCRRSICALRLYLPVYGGRLTPAQALENF